MRQWNLRFVAKGLSARMAMCVYDDEDDDKDDNDDNDNIN